MVTSPRISLSTHTTAPGAIFTLEAEKKVIFIMGNTVNIATEIILKKLLKIGGKREGHL